MRKELWINALKSVAKKMWLFDKYEKIITAIILAMIILVSFLISVRIGVNTQLSVATIAEYKTNNAKLSKSRADLKDANAELEALKKELASQEQTLTDFNEYKNNLDSKNAELSQLESSIQEKSGTISGLDSQIQEKQNKLDSLTGAITTAKSERILSAGVYIGGSDVDIGKYDVVLVSGSGNFFVRGSNRVNEIFGNDDRYGYIREYKNMRLGTGDEIEIKGNLKVKLLLKD